VDEADTLRNIEARRGCERGDAILGKPEEDILRVLPESRSGAASGRRDNEGMLVDTGSPVAVGNVLSNAETRFPPGDAFDSVLVSLTKWRLNVRSSHLSTKAYQCAFDSSNDRFTNSSRLWNPPPTTTETRSVVSLVHIRQYAEAVLPS
jgi:hypothetical protein